MNVNQAYYLLFKTIMSQGQDSQQVMRNSRALLLRLLEEVGDDACLTSVSYGAVSGTMGGSPALHRFPNKMGNFVFEALQVVATEFAGDPRAVFLSAGELKSRDLLIESLVQFPGIAEHKAKVAATIAGAYFSEERGVEHWESAASICPQLVHSLDDEIEMLHEIGRL